MELKPKKNTEIKKIGIITNPEKDTNLAFTRELTGWIQDFACEAVIGDNIFEDSDAIFVLGGDGTILRAAGRAAVRRKPLLGVNLGRLGYLTDVDRPDAKRALTALLKGEYRIEKRMMLRIEDSDLLALNDVCITRSSGKLIGIQLYINDEFIDEFRADGLIIATPTGSTAYTLSAGGPILKPDVEMIAITAICPHSLSLRPWVVSANDTVRVMASDARLMVDGENIGCLEQKQNIVVCRSEHITEIIKTTTLGFYEILRRKMLPRE
ncbi:MAG: NAD(+)/NADH kinase [Clostridiales bacterium]|jgi:NAD+ kinase|nr:NAD(+)/NADH kinase [Clostridiales bacterium]